VARTLLSGARMPDAACPRGSRAHRGGLLLLLAGVSSCALATNYDDPDGPRYSAEFAPPFDAAVIEAPEQLDVCSFNIEDAEHITEAISQLSADENLSRCSVVLLQEMDWTGARSIAEALGFDVVFYPGSIHHGKDFGEAVLSKWPILADKKLILPHRNPTNGRIRIAVSATLDMPLSPLTAYSVHSDTPWLGLSDRLDQAEAVAIDAASIDGRVVVAGDFNTSDPGSVEATVERFTSRSFTWATRDVPPSAHSPLGAETIDHVFVKALSVVAAGSPPTDASDHQPIWVKLGLLPVP
jgi:endonuclease/exonuclease/phosphatase (EEP) superfamily protein YafD